MYLLLCYTAHAYVYLCMYACAPSCLCRLASIKKRLSPSRSPSRGERPPQFFALPSAPIITRGEKRGELLLAYARVFKTIGDDDDGDVMADLRGVVALDAHSFFPMHAAAAAAALLLPWLCVAWVFVTRMHVCPPSVLLYRSSGSLILFFNDGDAAALSSFFSRKARVCSFEEIWRSFVK